MVNKLILVGNVGKQPEIINTEKSKIARFPLATEERYKDKNGEKQINTTWHNIVIWGDLCNVVENYVKKGSKLYLEGKQINRSFDKDGKTYYVSEMKCNNLQLLGSKSSNESDSDLNDQVTGNTSDIDNLPF